MKRKIKEFIKSNINLIDTENYDEFWRKVYADLGFIDYFDISTLVEFLYACGANPLANITVIPGGFMYHSERTEFTIPQHIRVIENNSFSRMQNLEHITLPPSVEVIHAEAFEGCSNLKTIEICNPKIQIRTTAFWSCPKIQTIKYYGTKEDWDKHLNEVQFTRCKLECTDGEWWL